MKLRTVISVLLTAASLLTVGCGGRGDDVVAGGDNFKITEDMAVYLTAYNRVLLKSEMADAGVDEEKPLSEQMRSDGESWQDYIYAKTLESIENILLYGEAAILDKYSVEEGIMYKANESLRYMQNSANELGLTVDEYVRRVFGDEVLTEALGDCTQMMSICEGYEMYLINSREVTAEETAAFADENPADFLKFDALRLTVSSEDVAKSLDAAASVEDFLKIASGVSGIGLTDSNKNGIPDSLELNDAVVSRDAAGEFAAEEGRAVGDTLMTEEDGKYTVTMITSLPERDTTPVWGYRMLYISSESSTDPLEDATSLREQWIEKEGGETGFSNLAARYSDDPTAYYGGKMTGIAAEDMPTEEIAEWICSTDRVEGDTAVFADGDERAYFIYYLGGGINLWQHEAETALKAKLADERIADIKDEISENLVIDEARLRQIAERVVK